MKMLAVVFAIASAGCGTHSVTQQAAPAVQTKIVDNGCKWVKFITASADDTAETKKQIIAHDQALVANCPDAAH